MRKENKPKQQRVYALVLSLWGQYDRPLSICPWKKLPCLLDTQSWWKVMTIFCWLLVIPRDFRPAPLASHNILIKYYYYINNHFKLHDIFLKDWGQSRSKVEMNSLQLWQQRLIVSAQGKYMIAYIGYKVIDMLSTIKIHLHIRFWCAFLTFRAFVFVRLWFFILSSDCKNAMENRTIKLDM